MTFVVNDEVVVGTVRAPLATYTIRPTSDGIHAIRQIDSSTLPPDSEPLVPPPELARSDRVRPITPPDREAPFPQLGADPPISGDEDGSRVDVLVVYTPAARRAEGNIEALINLMVAETNQAYANSGVIQRVNLVRTEEVGYTEQGATRDDLSHLQETSDGYMDEVHALRDRYAADLVHLIVDRDRGGDFDACGRAWLMLTPSNSFEAFAFGLTDYRCGGTTFAHELGHNMGLKHDRYQERAELKNYLDSKIGIVPTAPTATGRQPAAAHRRIRSANHSGTHKGGYGMSTRIGRPRPAADTRGSWVWASPTTRKTIRAGSTWRRASSRTRVSVMLSTTRSRSTT